MNETSAAPLLARHLNDPADDMVDVEHAASALGKLATPAEYEDLRTFFALYRATADEPSLVNAVVAVAEDLLPMCGAGGKTPVGPHLPRPPHPPPLKRGFSEVIYT